MEEEEYFSTDEMALATYLIMCGETFVDVEWEETYHPRGSRETCFFLFDRSSALESHIKDFNTGDARVDPRLFNATFGKMKRRMMDSNLPPHERRRRRTPA